MTEGLRFIHEFRDRAGSRRLYVRVKGARLPLPPTQLADGTANPDFLPAYHEALRCLGVQSPRMATSQGGKKGSIYVVQAGAFVKIGFSTNVERRLFVLAAGSPRDFDVRLVMPGTTRDEARLHRLFAAYRYNREWFRSRGRFKHWIDSEQRKIDAGGKPDLPNWQTGVIDKSNQ